MRTSSITLLLGTALCATGAGCVKSASPDADAGASDAAALVCSVDAPTACRDPAPHYSDVAPILAQRCVEPCHSGLPEGPWPLTDYEHVADWADVVRTDLLLCLMPPADAGVAIADEERLAILNWIRCGFPE
jgi:hypothetical protein